MGKGSRLALCCLGLLLSLTLFMRGRVPPPKVRDAAFFRPGSGRALVRLAGDVPSPGLYEVPVAASPVTVIKMALPRCRVAVESGRDGALPLQSGIILTVRRRGGEVVDFTATSMGARERLLLGIPLDPDRMTCAEWVLLPGIGPALARRIVSERHENGAFVSIEGLMRVPGIGPVKLSQLRKFFP